MAIAAFVRARDMLLADTATDTTITDSESGARTGPTLNEACERIILAFHEIVGFDAAAVMTTDPDTNLPICGVVEGFDPEMCIPFWDNELLDPDFNKFNHLARVTPPMATLVDAVDGDLDRSPRYSKLYADIGVADELRVAFVAGTSCIGIGVFIRAEHRGVVTPEELVDVCELLPVATKVLRQAFGHVEQASSSRPPAVLIVDANGDIRSSTPGAHAVLSELYAVGAVEDGVPGILGAAASRARWSRNPAQLATRAQGRNGEWLRLHVSPLDDGDGSVAVTIEQARPGDLIPIMLVAYGLTERETDVVQFLARGYSAKDIAAELMLSPHTVRDHIKSVYDKAGVNSKGELLARLFADHVLGDFHNSVRHVGSL